MDLRDLRYFETIAELQHLGRASARLHRTQPALTSSIRRLEAACGAALFEKAGRGIRLTEAGRRPGERPEVMLRADQSVAYGRVAELIGQLQQAGLNRIAFVTERAGAR